jgi:hypothetical protein
MPDMKAMLDGANATSFTNRFGIVTSPPLRIKVIKE